MIDLKKMAGVWRISLDESYEAGADDDGKLWFYRIAGARGHIFVNGRQELGVFTDRHVTANKLRAVHGVRALQSGDRETSFGFHPDQFDRIAEIIKAKRRRVLSEEQRAALVESGVSTRFSKHGDGNRFGGVGSTQDGRDV